MECGLGLGWHGSNVTIHVKPLKGLRTCYLNFTTCAKQNTSTQ